MSLPLPSTFMPLPLPMMIPFMGIQSGVMALMFGQNFQFGKRKISAMSNEEFNELTFEKLMQLNLGAIKGLIPTFEQSLADMRPFTEFIIREFGVMIQLLLGQAGNQFDKATQTAQDDFYHFMGWGHAPTTYHQDGTRHDGTTEEQIRDTNPPVIPPEEEPPTEEPPNNHNEFHTFIISVQDPTSFTTIRFTSTNGNLSSHSAHITSLLNDNSELEGTSAGRQQLLKIYIQQVEQFYQVKL